MRLDYGEEIRAARVVSSAGARKTYNSFLEGEELVSQQRSKVNGVPLNYEYMYMNLFMGFDTNPGEFGLGTENHWIYESWGSEPKDGFSAPRCPTAPSADKRPTWPAGPGAPRRSGSPTAAFATSSSLSAREDRGWVPAFGSCKGSRKNRFDAPRLPRRPARKERGGRIH
ncbi:MAG: hypothetical protein R6V85_14560 [Polyangia bacterium]